MGSIAEAITSVESPTIETPEVETPEVETPEVESPETSDEPIEGGEKAEKGFRGDMGPTLKSYLKELQATDPTKARALRDEFYSSLRGAQRTWYQEFPGGPKEARELKQMISEAGGKEGISAVMGDINFYHELDAKLEKADPSVIDAIADFSPQAFAGLAPKFLSKFQELNPEQYASTITKMVVGQLESSGLGTQLYLIKRELERGDAAEAGKLIAQIEKWMGDSKAFAERKPEVKPPDEREQQFKTREDQLRQKEISSFQGTVTRNINEWRDGEIKKQLGAFLKDKKISTEKYGDIRLAVLNRLAPAVKASPGFNDKIEAYGEAMDQQGMEKYLKSIIGEKLPSITKTVYRLWFSDFSKKPVPANGEKPKEAGITVIGKRPEPEQIDRGKTDRKMILSGMAYLKDGRKVSWANA